MTDDFTNHKPAKKHKLDTQSNEIFFLNWDQNVTYKHVLLKFQ